MVIFSGDDVAVRNTVNDDNNIYGNKYSSFGGYLIQEFDNEASSIIG